MKKIYIVQVFSQEFRLSQLFINYASKCQNTIQTNCWPVSLERKRRCFMCLVCKEMHRELTSAENSKCHSVKESRFVGIISVAWFKSIKNRWEKSGKPFKASMGNLLPWRVRFYGAPHASLSTSAASSHSVHLGSLKKTS